MRKPARHFVKVCVFILPGANMSNNRLEEDFRIAREVWGVDFDITVRMLDTQRIFVRRLTSWDFACEGRGDTEIEMYLYQVKRTLCPDPSTIAVFYTGTNTIEDFTRACTKRRRTPDSPVHQPTFMNVIFISNMYAPDTLAHEIGHCFFFSHHINRRDSDLTTPGVQPHVEGMPYNIMAPGHIRRFPTTATPEQIRRAIQANSPRVIFERGETAFEDRPRVTPHHIPRKKRFNSRPRTFNENHTPHVGQSWPVYFIYPQL